MIKLAENLNLDAALVERLKNLSEKELKKAALCAEACSKGNFSCLKTVNDIIRLAVILQCAVKVKEKYLVAGISEEVYRDTMSDIKIWCENNDNKGLKAYGWLKNHVSFELFRLGRLQFQLYACKNKTLFYNKLPFSYGDNLIYVHIPQGEKLERDKCIEAFIAAEAFFKRYFPDYKYSYYFCESWLLFEDNRKFMAQDSNILSFGSLFTHCYSVAVEKQSLERIFGGRRLFKKSYPEKTSLQRRAKKYIADGNRLGIGVAVAESPFVLD